VAPFSALPMSGLGRYPRYPSPQRSTLTLAPQACGGAFFSPCDSSPLASCAFAAPGDNAGGPNSESSPGRALPSARKSSRGEDKSRVRIILGQARTMRRAVVDPLGRPKEGSHPPLSRGQASRLGACPSRLRAQRVRDLKLAAGRGRLQTDRGLFGATLWSPDRGARVECPILKSESPGQPSGAFAVLPSAAARYRQPNKLKR
jgi:hypothetical protein